MAKREIFNYLPLIQLIIRDLSLEPYIIDTWHVIDY
jgi:hypothetical protein